jgi:hypothetical protein
MNQTINPISTAFTSFSGQSWLRSQVNQPKPIAGSLAVGIWNTVRWGLRLMVGSLTAITLGFLGLLLFRLFPRYFVGSLLLGVVGVLLVGLVGYLVGVAMSLAAPAEARLGRLQWLCGTGLGCGAQILLIALPTYSLLRWDLGRSVLAVSYGLALTGVVFLAAGCVGYSYYLAMIARRSGNRRLAGCFLAYIPALLLLFVVPVVALELGILEPILPQALAVHLSHKQVDRLALAEVVLAISLGLWWKCMVWLLLKRLSPPAPANRIA